MREKILDILEKHYHGRNFIENKCAEELLALLDVSLSLFGVPKCPNGNCDNNGTIATQEYQSGEGIPEPCELCHRKKELLNNEG